MYNGLWRDLAALLGVPLVVWITATGVGLLVERSAQVRLPNALLAPLGFGAIVSILLGVYSLGAGNSLALPLLSVLVIGGFALSRRELAARLNPGWPGLAAIAAYLVFNASVLATGHWTFTGYNQVDDPAFEFLLIQHLQAAGVQVPRPAPSNAANVLHAYLTIGYPLGAQSYLAALCGYLHTSVAVLWQGFISALVGLGAMAASTLTGRVLDRRLGALAGFVAVSAALTFQYALLGSIKEIAVLVALLSAAAVIRHAILDLRGSGAVAVAGVSTAALLSTYGSAGLPYAMALVGAAIVAVVAVHRQRPARDWLRPALIGAVTLGVFSIPAAVTLRTSYRVVSGGFTGAHPIAPQLGPLFRPLPLSEVSGVWLYGDYRLAIPGRAAAALTALASAALLLLLVVGAVRMLRRREPGPLMLLVAVGLVLLIVMPRVTPYAKAKLLAIGSPAVVLAAAGGLAVGPRRLRMPAAVAASGLVAAVLGSDALAYHNLPVAPTDRLAAISQVAQQVRGQGLVLDNEFDQYAKYFALPARLNISMDAGAPAPIQLITPVPTWDHSFDFDQEPLGYVESFPYLVSRRSPASSRPPANFRLVFQNAYYELWRRDGQPHVLAHLGAQTPVSAQAPLSCSRLRALVARAPPSSRLLVSTTPPNSGFDVTAATSRTHGWKFSLPHSVIPFIPGRATETISIPTGSYEVWALGDFPRRTYVQLDGHTIGSVVGVNAPDTWLVSEGGRTNVAGGQHALSIVRPGGGLSPGDGLQESFTAVTLQASSPPSLDALPVGGWRQLCARSVDWVELVQP